MSLYTECIGYVAPFYNLALVVVVVLMMIKLLRTASKNVYVEPWKWLFYAILIFILEEILTVLDASGYNINDLVYPLLETLIISCFIYMLLLQREYVKGKKK